MKNSEKNRFIIAGILSENLSDNFDNIREIEKRLNVDSREMELGDVYHLELVNKIYEKLLTEKLFTKEQLWQLLYNLEYDYTIVVYYKLGLINQLLNKGDLYEKIVTKYRRVL
jgi:hypothetical protein